ncbi:hypothetical protein D3C80_1626540 [compost metagenome]
MILSVILSNKISTFPFFIAFPLFIFFPQIKISELADIVPLKVVPFIYEIFPFTYVAW